MTPRDPRHPVPRRRRRPGRQGRELPRAARRRRPRRAGRAVRRRRAPTSSTFLDISASHEGRATTLEVVSRTAEQVFIPLTVGGGVSSTDDVDTLLRAGADKVAVNTAAIHRPELVAEIADRFGNQVLVLSVDARRAPGTDSGFEVTTHGGRKSAGLDAIAWAKPRLRARRRRDPAQRHGRRRHPRRLRPRPDPGRTPRGHRPGDRAAAARVRPSTSRRPSRPAPTRCWPPASSTSARWPSGT